jgi:hypothetical protein
VTRIPLRAFSCANCHYGGSGSYCSFRDIPSIAQQANCRVLYQGPDPGVLVGAEFDLATSKGIDKDDEISNDNENTSQ